MGEARPRRTTCFRWQATRAARWPLTPSVSESPFGPRRPARRGPTRPMNCEDAGPMLTAVVHCDLIVRGLDVAPAWPSA
jgi:hypothetical protein